MLTTLPLFYTCPKIYSVLIILTILLTPRFTFVYFIDQKCFTNVVQSVKVVNLITNFVNCYEVIKMCMSIAIYLIYVICKIQYLVNMLYK